MGKVVLFLVIFVSLTVVTIISSAHDRTASTGDILTNQHLDREVKRISNYALQFGVQQIKSGNINPLKGDTTEVFQDFFVLDGAIDSIHYEEVFKDTIEIISYVFCRVGKQEQLHSGKAYLQFNPISITPTGVENAIETTGDVRLKGAATVDGTIDEYSSFEFEVIFGYTKEKVKQMATNYYVDAENNITPIDNVTWMECVDYTDFQITDNGYYGSGLLVIDGSMKMSGGTFDGIIWVTENLTISGNPIINGAVFVEGITEVQTTVITGTPLVRYDEDEANKTYLLSGGDAYSIIGWYQ